MNLTTIVLVIVALVVIAGIGAYYFPQYTKTVAPQPSLLPNITLYTFPESKLGNEFELTANIKSIFDVNNFSARFELPEGITFISGDLTWNGDLKANEPIDFNIGVKATKVGNWTVKLVTNTAVSTERCISINETKIFYCIEPETSLPKLLTEPPIKLPE